MPKPSENLEKRKFNVLRIMFAYINRLIHSLYPMHVIIAQATHVTRYHLSTLPHANCYCASCTRCAIPSFHFTPCMLLLRKLRTLRDTISHTLPHAYYYCASCARCAIPSFHLTPCILLLRKLRTLRDTIFSLYSMHIIIAQAAHVARYHLFT